MSWIDQEIIPKNYIADIPDSALPIDIVSDCSNIGFSGGVARSLPSPMQTWIPQQIPITLGYYEFASFRRWAYGANNAQALTVFDGANQYDVTPSTLTASSYWYFDALNGFAIITNNKNGEVPHSLIADGSPSTDAIPLVGWTSSWTAKIVLGHRNQLIAVNMQESSAHYGTRVRWSNSAISGLLPTEWTATVSNNAGAFDPAVPGGEILSVCTLGDSVFLGGRGGVWIMTYTGGNFVYSFAATPVSCGVRGENCMVSLGDSIAILSQNDLVQFDGTAERSLLVDKHARKLFTNMGQKSRLFYLEATRQLYIFYGTGSQSGYSTALVWDRDSDTWGRLDFTNQYNDFAKGYSNQSSLETSWTALSGKYTWATWGSRANRPHWASTAYASDASFFIGSRSGSMDNISGNLFNWSLMRTNIPAPGGKFARVRDLKIDASGQGGQLISIRIGSSQKAGESVSWGNERSYTLGVDELLHGDLRRGKFISYQLRGNGNCQISKLSMRWREQGSNR